MPYLTDLADACRKSGLKVVEVPGWKTRGHGPMVAPRGVAAHHTATSDKASGDYPSLRIVRDGHSSLPGPLAHLGLGRSGTVYVIAAGRCWHAGQTDDIAYSNSYCIGIEAEHDGLENDMPEEQYKAYASLCKALQEHYGTKAVRGHKEFGVPYGRKIDPVFDMNTFRSNVSSSSAAPAALSVTKEEISAMQRSISSAQYPLKATGTWGNNTDYASRCLRAYLSDPSTNNKVYRSRGWHRVASKKMKSPGISKTIKHFQWRLGFAKSDRDGVWGPKTEGAWRAFEKAAKEASK